VVSDLERGLPLLEDLGDVSGKAVLVRLDLNVPLAVGDDGERVVSDDFRIRAALPTLEWLRSRGARVTVATHLGRPDGAPDPRYDLTPVRRRLDELAPGVEMLENVRFSPGEKRNDPVFVRQLVAGQDLYVNDAFGVCHRADASVVGPPALLPSAAGRLVEREVHELAYLLDDPARPFAVVVGGAKVSDKIGLIGRLAELADSVLVGGGMAFTFAKARGIATGDSLLDEGHVEACREILERHDNLVLPVDFVCAGPGVELRMAVREDAAGGGGGGDGGDGDIEVFVGAIPEGWRGFDIGPATIGRFREMISAAATVLWNGPMGVFEDPRFEAGTKAVAEATAACSGHTVVGGGDSVAAVGKLGLSERIGHISTGGGASLELLEHGDLPGLKALRESASSRSASS
jgi:phosphoglycerate kinase